GARAFLAAAERPLLVEADPGRRDEVGVEAGEPGVTALLRRAGFAREIAASERTRTLAGAATDHVPQHVGDDPGVRLADGARRDFLRLRQRQSPADVGSAHDSHGAAAGDERR